MVCYGIDTSDLLQSVQQNKSKSQESDEIQIKKAYPVRTPEEREEKMGISIVNSIGTVVIGGIIGVGAIHIAASAVNAVDQKAKKIVTGK